MHSFTNCICDYISNSSISMPFKRLSKTKRNIFSQRCPPPTIIVEKMWVQQMWKKNVWQPNVEEECVVTKCGKITCENVWGCVRICSSKCGCAKSVISDNVPTYGTYPNVEMMSSPRLSKKPHCSRIPQGTVEFGTFAMGKFMHNSNMNKQRYILSPFSINILLLSTYQHKNGND